MNEVLRQRGGKVLARDNGHVCICGIGARTPLGLDAPFSAAAVRCGISALQFHPACVDKAGEPMRVAGDAEMDPWLPAADRIATLLRAAVAEAMNGLSKIRRGARMPFLIGLPEPRPGLPADLAESLTTRIRSEFAPTILCTGHAAGLMAIEQGARLIASGKAPVCLVGAADSYLNPETLEWLDATGRLSSSENRNGFPPGEAAGACLLATTAVARSHGLPILAQIASTATTVERIPIRSQAVCIGEGLTVAIKAATAPLGNERIAATYCDLNGERYRNEEWVYALLRVQEAFVDHAYVSPADCWGDVGAASGALFAALAITAAQRGYSRGPSSLLWAGSESGYRSAVALIVPETEG
jgi:3-oxoacyl-[acyl-carrier-protein] synthase-1